MRVRRQVLLGAAVAFAAACSSKQAEPQFNKDAPATKPASEPVAHAPSEPARAVLQREPTSPDPLGGKFSLADATADLAGKGALHAQIETSAGTLDCTLFADKAPNTVANFVGLARGLRPFWDAKTASWAKRPLYDGTSFHRTIAGFMIQGGDQLGDGSGGVGYEIPDELAPGLSHDRAGLLCMANRGPNTNGGQFFITDAAAPHLTQMKSYTIFGECTPVDVIHKIASAPHASHASERPEPPIPIVRVQVSKK